MTTEEVLDEVDRMSIWDKYQIYWHYVSQELTITHWPLYIILYELKEEEIKKLYKPDKILSNNIWVSYLCSSRKDKIYSFEEFINKKNRGWYNDPKDWQHDFGIYGHYWRFKNEIKII